ncbi:helix-turn-helix domain containing protein [Sphingomonas sp. H160509]|uniref:TetR/AcrR family transcriptional regulator n=1 Tax=Sphingomonas sp. H160509 TaxID=2955313 RepID=UPI0021E7D863|nr:TetR/AcrR family transcriptional regulator [Sphingomonas sp. H160509]MDD1449666.1 helix-turn-helix domain containing protein [Sphingomonas sp. H160509]
MPVQRRSQAERREETSTKAIDAAIACLYRDGYSATTTLSVAAEAGISRGALLHHFPTKVELILAVALEVVRRSQGKRRKIIVARPRGLPRFAAITDASWATLQEPEAMTLLEILMASRGNPELATRLPEVIETFESWQLSGMLEIADDIGFTNVPQLEAMSKLHQAAMRGLSIELLFAKDRSKIDAAFALLGWYKQMFTERMLAERDAAAAEATPEAR